MERPANAEMIEGFRDGHDLSAPEPSGNRSHSYRHGFQAGRNDKLPYGEGPFHGIHPDDIRRMADDAMAKDEC